MTREEIIAVLKEILLGEEGLVLEESVENLSEQTSLLNDLVMDSLQVLNFIVLIEERFNISFNVEELNLDMFDEVKELINFIEKKL